jgi:hypothetical protein
MDSDDYELIPWEQEAPAVRYAASKLSRAASAVWSYITAEPDPMGDPSGDCGDMIAEWERDCRVRAVLAAGYDNPGQYNAELVARTTPKWSSILEIEFVCDCGAAFHIRHHYILGDGMNTSYVCPSCGKTELEV